MDSFVENLSISCDGPVAKYLHMMQGGLSSNLGYYVYYFFMIGILGSLGSNLAFIIPFGIT